MLNASVARRYARALFELARDRGQIQEIGQELAKATQLLTAQRDLRGLWEHEEVSPRVKRDIINQTLAPHLSQVLRSFLDLLVDKRREKWLADVHREYTALGYAALGVVQVEVRSATELDVETLTALENSLAQRLGAQKVELTTSLDRDMIGGLSVRVGDLLLDGSVRTQLKRMKERLAQGVAV